ncbi:MAG: hypothetical protein VKK42_24510 [Lyngbya sp.]|nr:hypothetical protein [Lyngbya sp.]
MLNLFNNFRIPLTISLLLGGWFWGGSSALAQMNTFEERVCQQYQQVRGTGQEIECSQGFNQGFDMGLDDGQEYRQSEVTPQITREEIAALIPNDTTQAYQNGFVAGYQLGFQEGYQF